MQFAPDGVLHAANSTGIYAIAPNGTATLRSANPTSQFAFDSLSTVVTTNGSAYGGIFGFRTDRVFLDTPVTTLLNGGGPHPFSWRTSLGLRGHRKAGDTETILPERFCRGLAQTRGASGGGAGL